MSQLKLAQTLGVNRQTIVAWELSKNPPKDRTRVLELARILDLDDREANILLAAAFLDPLPLWYVPYHRNPMFTGREEILVELHHMLVPGRTTAVTQSQAISGLGGIGKTQTALEYAYRYRHSYSSVFWLQADSREIISLAYVQLAQELGLSERNETDQIHIIGAVKRWLKSKTHWLLILDNVQDLSMIKEFLPPGHQGYVLLTTRIQVTEPFAYARELGIMTEQEGTLFLLRRTKVLDLETSLNQATVEQYVAAARIWEVMNGLPLALDQAGAYILETGCSFSRYLDLYHQRYDELLKRRGKPIFDHPESAYNTILLSFERVEEASPIAANLMKLCTFLYPDVIPGEVISEGFLDLDPNLNLIATDSLALDEAVGVLRRFSLIHRNVNSQVFSIHRLIQVILKDQLNGDEQRQWAVRAVKAINSVFPNVSFETLLRCETYIPQAQACATLIEQWSMTFVEAVHLLRRTGHYLLLRGQYSEAEPLFHQARIILEQTLDHEPLDLAAVLNNLAEIYRLQGSYIRAEPLYQQALTILERELGSEHPSIGAVLNNLGLLYVNLEQYTQAEFFFQQALAIRERVLGPKHLDVAQSLNNLAWCYQFQEEYYDRAKKFCMQAIVICEENMQSEYAPVVMGYSLNTLAEIYLTQRRYAQVKLILQQAYEILEQTQNQEHIIMGITFKNLAKLLYAQRKYIEAESLYQKSLVIYEHALGPEHLEIASVLNDLAKLYKTQRKYAQADKLHQRILTIYDQTLGLEHPNAATALRNYASLLRKMKRNRDAIELEARAELIKANKGISSQSEQAKAEKG